MNKKLTVMVLFGGKSPEHQISIASALSVMQALDPKKYTVIPVKIGQDGSWQSTDNPEKLISQADKPTEVSWTDLSLNFARKEWLALETNMEPSCLLHRIKDIDVVFPLLHGPYGEDGTVQGLLELVDLPYVGAGVAASAIGMDKGFMKLLFQRMGLPVTGFLIFKRHDWEENKEAAIKQILGCLEYPVFVKPVNQGSTIGISKALEEEELRAAIVLAFCYSEKIIVEQGLDCRELECGVLGNKHPEVSVLGEIVPSKEFYDYEAKYTPGLVDIVIPATFLPEKVFQQAKEVALKAFTGLDCFGMARVDFFLGRKTDRLYLNEINTIPGFTTTSIYPKLWEASGLFYPQLLDRLIELALEQHRIKVELQTSYDPTLEDIRATAPSISKNKKEK